MTAPPTLVSHGSRPAFCPSKPLPRNALQAHRTPPTTHGARLFTQPAPRVLTARALSASGSAGEAVGQTLALAAAEASAAAAAVATFPSEISCSTFFLPVPLSLSLQASVSSLFSSISFSSGGKIRKLCYQSAECQQDGSISGQTGACQRSQGPLLLLQGSAKPLHALSAST